MAKPKRLLYELASEFPSSVELGEPFWLMIGACPFLLCQNPMVANSPLPVDVLTNGVVRIEGLPEEVTVSFSF